MQYLRDSLRQEQKQMRRLIAWIALLTLTITAATAGAENLFDWFTMPTATPVQTATASPTATPAPDAFRFRDGIRWGMNRQQVGALESAKMTERTGISWSIMLTDEKVAVSRFTANLVFMFREDRLLMISYEFQQQNSMDDFSYLSGALSSLYGEKANADPLRIKALMDAINPNRYKAELITNAVGWSITDGTTVYLYHYSPEAFAILYVSPELGNRIYQTNGL